MTLVSIWQYIGLAATIFSHLFVEQKMIEFLARLRMAHQISESVDDSRLLIGISARVTSLLMGKPLSLLLDFQYMRQVSGQIH